MTHANPYSAQPNQAFWRPAVAERHLADIEALWKPIDLKPEDSVATAGSCFAQHIGRHLRHRGANYLDLEIAPDIFADQAEMNRFGYGLFSCRFGNIYSARQLRQLFEEAFGKRIPAERVWAGSDRYFDALRPGIDPVGQNSKETVLALRERHLEAVKKMFETLDLFVFTLGLTECWEHLADGTVYPTAPGTICGQFDESLHAFRNLTYPETREDMASFWCQLREINPRAKMLLTVSPVPLIATATDDHVLPATTYSKSVLRAVAGDLAVSYEDIDYFPSYEIIAGHPSRGQFYNPDLRSVNDAGVKFVMSHFFSGDLANRFLSPSTESTMMSPANNEVMCDEEDLEEFIGD